MPPDEVVALFSEIVSFEIPSDEDALPWIGRANGKQAVVRWLEGLGMLIEPQAFDVEDILASEMRVAVVGSASADQGEAGRRRRSSR